MLNDLAGIAQVLHSSEKRRKEAAAQAVGRGDAQLATLGEQPFIQLQAGLEAHDRSKDFCRGFGESRARILAAGRSALKAAAPGGHGFHSAFFKQAAEISGGSFQITSEKGKGTVLTARFVLSSIDRMPLGDMSMTVHNLMVYHEEVDFRYCYACDGREFVLDTREMKEMLGDVPLHSPEVSAFIMDYLKENHREVSGGKNL